MGSFIPLFTSPQNHYYMFVHNDKLLIAIRKKPPYFISSTKPWQSFPPLHQSQIDVRKGILSIRRKGGSCVASNSVSIIHGEIQLSNCLLDGSCRMEPGVIMLQQNFLLVEIKLCLIFVSKCWVLNFSVATTSFQISFGGIIFHLIYEYNVSNCMV